MKRFLKMTKDYYRYHFHVIKYVKWLALLYYALSIAQGLIPTLSTLMLAYAATLLPEGTELTGALIIAVIGISITTVLGNVLSVWNRLITRKMVIKVGLPVMQEFHDICCSLDYRWREKRESADLMSRVSSAIDQHSIVRVLRCMPNLLKGLLVFILPAVLLWRYGWYMPVLATVFALEQCILTYHATKEANTFYNAESTENRLVETYASQLYDKQIFPELKVFRQQEWLLSKWEHMFDILRGKTFRQEMRFRIFDFTAPLIQTAAMLATIAVFMLAGRNAAGVNNAAAVVIVINACFALCSAANEIRMEYTVLQSFSEDVSNFYLLADHRLPGSQDVDRSMQPVEVELNDVHFSYDDETEALSGVTLDIRPGEKLAIVGENGSGKTTLAKLILSLYKPTSGTLTLSNASGVLPQACASAVMQEYVRYLLSVRENIGFGDPEKLTDDAALTAAYESVTGEPLFDALDAQLGAKFGGHELSGGQWQRLALARAYLKEAPLIVLDEPNASIDAFAEAAMIKRMFEMAKDKACVFITHRLTTTALADRIIVMKDGRICEEGTHEELMRRNGEYARMYSVQAEMYA